MQQTITIGRLAKLAGVNIDTVRYYERNGLLPAPPRRASGYREYGAADVDRLLFIRRAKELGFTLAESAELLSLSAGGSVQDVKRKAEERLAEVKRKVAELKRVQRGLEKLIDACPGQGDLRSCPIVAALAGRQGRGEAR